MSLLHLCALIVVISLLSMGGSALRFHKKYLNLCSEDEQRSYGFGMTWGWVDNDIIFIFGWTILLRIKMLLVITKTTLTFSYSRFWSLNAKFKSLSSTTLGYKITFGEKLKMTNCINMHLTCNPFGAFEAESWTCFKEFWTQKTWTWRLWLYLQDSLIQNIVSLMCRTIWSGQSFRNMKQNQIKPANLWIFESQALGLS